MFWLKHCPRCGGDLTDTWAPEGEYVACLQCGYELTASEEYALRTGVPIPAARKHAQANPV